MSLLEKYDFSMESSIKNELFMKISAEYERLYGNSGKTREAVTFAEMEKSVFGSPPSGRNYVRERTKEKSNGKLL